MIRLTYASTALKDWGSEDLLKLLSLCRKNNTQNDITGILLYSKRTFFQILEGDEDVVGEVYDKINKDPRHRNVTVVNKETITRRAFPYWSMAYDNIDTKTINNIPGLNNFFEKDFTPDGFASNRNIMAPLMAHLRTNLVNQIENKDTNEELSTEHEDPYIRFLHKTIRFGVKSLAFLMVVIIFMGIFDVLHVMYEKITSPPYFLMSTNAMLETFGAFLIVLIAIEIFINITIYIRSDVIPVKLVVATALMAISRKVIVFDYKNLTSDYVSATSLAVLTLAVAYWLVQKKDL